MEKGSVTCYPLILSCTVICGGSIRLFTSVEGFSSSVVGLLTRGRIGVCPCRSVCHGISRVASRSGLLLSSTVVGCDLCRTVSGRAIVISGRGPRVLVGSIGGRARTRGLEGTRLGSTITRAGFVC